MKTGRSEQREREWRRFFGTYLYFLAGLAGGYALWGSNPHSEGHYWLWTLVNWALFVAGYRVTLRLVKKP